MIETSKSFSGTIIPVRVALAACLLFATSTGLAAQEAAKPAAEMKPADDANVLARIDGVEITERDMRIAARDMGQQFANVPEAQRKAAILSMLIDVNILAKQADADGLAKDPDFLSRMALLRARALHNTYFRLKVQKLVTDEDVRKRYEEEISRTKPEVEVRARHILVKTENEAKELIKQLDGGADFVELAKSKSTGPSGVKGGDLGFFGKGRMVPEFDKVVFTLEIGSYTKEPVKTQFGFHIIKVEERRKAPPPAFQTVAARIKDILMRDRYNELVTEARKNAKIEFVDKSLAPGAIPAPKSSN